LSIKNEGELFYLIPLQKLNFFHIRRASADPSTLG
jgi:hypothetical protein